MDRGAKVLVVKKHGGEVREVPWNEPSGLANEEEWTVELAKDLSARIKVRLRSHGDYGVYLRQHFEIPGQRRSRLEKHYSVLFAGATVEDESFSDLEDLDTPVSMAVSLAVPRFADSSPEGPVFPLPDDFFTGNRSMALFATLEKRSYDILIGNPRGSRLRVVLLLPEGMSVKSLPRERKLETRFGRFSLTFTKPSERKLVLERVLETTSARVPVADYESFRNFAAQVDDLKNEKIILEAN